jgi:hypothetical protein
MAISIHKSGDDVTIRGGGAILGECLTALQKCADTNACFSNGLKISEKCIETIAQHSQHSKCADQAFGLKGKY